MGTPDTTVLPANTRGDRPRLQIPALDMLRAAAILWVILHHMAVAGFLAPVTNPVTVKFFDAGPAGVDLFFVLSGYLITTIVLAELVKTDRLDVPRFWYRRWMRTLPAYYVTLGVMFLGGVVHVAHGTMSPRWSYLVFLQSCLIDFDRMRFSWSWSLCVEELFYLSLPVLVWLLGRTGAVRPVPLLRLIAVAAIGVSVISRTWYADHAGPAGSATDAGYAIPYCRLDGIAIGMIIATLPPMRSAARSTALGGVALILLGGLIWSDLPEWFQVQRFLPLSLVFGAGVYASVSANPWRNWHIPGGASIAALSYSLYLVHPIVTVMVLKALPTASPVMAVLVFAGGTAAAAVGLRYLVELPFLRIRDHRPRPSAELVGRS